MVPERGMFGVPSLAARVQPEKSMGFEVLL